MCEEGGKKKNPQRDPSEWDKNLLCERMAKNQGVVALAPRSQTRKETYKGEEKMG